MERDRHFIEVACIVAKEVVDKESFVRRFGLSFEKDIHWKAASSLLDHLSRSSLFKAVLITINKVPFKLEPDVSEELKGRLRWAKRNYNYHKYMAEGLKHHVQTQPYAAFHPKQMKEEEDYSRKFLQTMRSIEGGYTKAPIVAKNHSSVRIPYIKRPTGTSNFRISRPFISFIFCTILYKNIKTA